MTASSRISAAAPVWHDPGVADGMSPAVHVISDAPGNVLRVLVATPEAVLTESRYHAGRPGADPHVHRRHADIFHIVHGALVFLLGPAHDEHRLTVGDTVIAPPGVVHGFRVAADEDTVYLNVHAPGFGFDVYLEKRRGLTGAALEAMAAAHDVFDEPRDGGLPAGRGVIAPDGLIETWRRWAEPGAETDRVAEVMAMGIALAAAGT
jgi:quercetin dioxygenase-like cupin family protein